MNIFTDFEVKQIAEYQGVGYLSAKKTSEFIPFYNKLFFLSEPSFIEGQVVSFLENTLKRQLHSSSEYEQYLLRKSSRPVYDLYACFQPFNESLKALYPFFLLLQDHLKKDDVILNLWDRSGWITSLLCGLFPDQKIVTTWEGNKDVLGYSGYNYWFRDVENLQVLFTEDYSQLPFSEHTVAAVIGYDFFHRTSQVKLLKELDRITRTDAVVIFPHIHLSNSEPDPFFERGCQQYHGTDYLQSFGKRDALSRRITCIFSEPELFLFNDFQGRKPVSEPDTRDYNALIVNMPGNEGPDLVPFSPEKVPETGYIVVNPLIKIDFSFQKTCLDLNSFGGNLKKLLDRHPVYLERIKNAIDLSLDENSVKILFLARQAYPIKEIRKQLQLTEPVFNNYLKQFEDMGLLHQVAVKESGIRLQNFLMNQNYQFPREEQTVAALWHRACSFFPERVFLTDTEDDSVYTYENTHEIVRLICSTLAGEGLKKGDRILIYARQNPEAIFLFLSCTILGVVVIPLNEALSDRAVSSIVEATQPRLCFLGHREADEQGEWFGETKRILFDEEESRHGVFSEWINPEINFCDYPSVRPEDDCVILFTSGSTGLPKGIPVSNGRLFRSAELVSKQFDWDEDDRFISKGNIGSMSGLRNSVVVPLFKGSATLVTAHQNLFALGEMIRKYEVSILGANPALLSQLIRHQERFKEFLRPLKKVLCTGNNLTGLLKQSFKESFDLQVINYYGLTETTGICIAETPGEYNYEDGFLGYAVGCIAQAVDEKGQVCQSGEVGELRIFSENIFDHYLTDANQSLVKGGWLYTGDHVLIREDGSVKLVGRNSDIFKTNDEQMVYISALENFLRRKQGVKDACAVLGEGDDLFVYIAGNVSAETIQAEIKNEFKLTILQERIIFREELPYNPQGKINKNFL